MWPGLGRRRTAADLDFLNLACLYTSVLLLAQLLKFVHPLFGGLQAMRRRLNWRRPPK